MFGRRKRNRRAGIDDYTVEPMEPRVLLSADALGVDAGVLDADDAARNDWDLNDANDWSRTLASHDETDAAPLSSRDGSDERTEIVFLDAGIENGRQLLDDLLARDGTKVSQVHLIDSNSDGVEQITQVLAGKRGIDAVHILSHGAAGQIQLGSSTLSTGSLDGYTDQLNDWGSALAESGDILIYGCDLGADDQGEALVNAIGALTGADVAASVDQTGHVAQGGDWDLEHQVGMVETKVFSPGAFPTWQGTLAAFIVDTTADTADADPGDGVAEDASGNTSLRAAIMEANALTGADTIYLADGNYGITRSGLNDDQGDFDIRSDLRIVGESANGTVIDGNGSYQVFEVHDAAITVSFENLKIEDGATGLGGSGGAALSINAGANTPVVTVSNGWFYNNAALSGGEMGGAVNNEGNLTITNSLFDANRGFEGGAIWNGPSAVLSMENVTISGNQATGGDGGGLFNEGDATLRHVTITNNSALGLGGGVIHDGGAISTDIGNSIIAGNSAGGSSDVENKTGNFTSAGGNIIQDASGSGTDFAPSERGIDPLLSGLTDNGGELMTHAPGAPAIDAADLALAPNTDQRGFLRGDGSPDIGAYEASASVAGTSHYLDRFDTNASFAGDDGTLSWTNDWQEIGETSGPDAGDIRVVDEFFGDGGGNVELIVKTNNGVWREADLSGATTATLSFDCAIVDFEVDDHLVVYAQVGGGTGPDNIAAAPGTGTWYEIARYSGPADDVAYSNNSIDLSAYIGSDTRIMFLADGAFNGNDKAFVDNVQIELSTSSPVNTSLSPVQDTYISNDAKDSNYGSDTVIHLDESGGGLGDGRLLLQFDLSTIPAGATITSATLRVEATNTPSESSIINVYEVTDAWDEGSATWNERQAGTGWTSGAGGSVDTTPPTPPSLEVSGLGTHTWDVTDLVQGWQSGATVNNGLMLAGEDIGGAVFDYDSREGGIPPQLVISYVVNDVNVAPTFSSFVGQVTSGDEDSEITVTFGNLAVQGDEDDADGTVDAFIVKSVTSGTLRIGTSAAAATAWVAGSNDTLDALTNAYWTPDPDDNGTVDAFEVVAQDDDGAESFTNVTVQVTVNPINDAPTATNLSSTSPYNEGDASVAITDIVVSDVDTGESITATLTLANTATGSLSANDGATYNGGTGVWSISGSLAAVNTALANLVFTPTADNDVDTTISVSIDDGDEDASGPLTGTITLDVTPANDAPTATNLSSTSPYNEGDASVAITDIVVSDVDTGESITATLTLADTSTGSLSANDGATYNGGTGVWSISGSLAAVNTALANLVFTPTADNDVDTTIGVSIDDGDEDASGPLTGTITLDVTPANDAPTATNLSSTSAYNEGDATVAITDIVVSDVDTAETVTATLTLANTATGSLSANDGATYNGGTGVWSISGSLAAVNTALANLVFTPTANNDVDTTIGVSIDDGDEDASGPLTGTITLDVTPANDAPTITSTAVTTATEDAAYSYTFAVNDVDVGDTLTLSAPTLPAWLSFDPATGILSGTPSNAEVGTHNVVLRVNDGTVDVDESFTITVSNANDAPTITSTAVTTATEDAAYSYTFAVNDVDVGDTLTLSAPTLPAWLSFDPATGILSGTPSNAEVGTHNVVLRVNDGTVDVDESFTITVSNANDAPTITSTAVTTATEDAAYSYTFAVNDVDVGDTLTLSAPTLPAWLSFDPATGILSGTPSNAEVGTHNVVLRVNDGTVDVDESFTITVSNANDAPTITSTAVTTATEDAAYSYTFAVNDVDVGDTLTLSAPTLPAWLSFDPATGILSGTPSNAEVGTHNVVLRVNDGTVDVDESFTITVSNANDAPTITSTAVTTATEDAAYSYTFAVNDVDVGDTLTLSAPTLPAWLSFDPATGILSGTPSNAEVGTHNVVLRVNDGTVDVDESFTITVSNANDAPTITSTAVTTATEDAAYSYTFAVNDVDVGDTLTLSAPTLPAWLSFDPATGILSGTPSNAEVGTHNVVLRVNDGTVDVDESFTITVSNANDAPTITSTAVTTATEDAAYSYTFAVNDVDVGDTLTLSAPTLPAWLSFDPATGILSGTPSNAEVGTHNVVLRVNDGTVDVDESFTITVSNANDAPTITSTAVTTATEDAAYSYTFAVNDVDVGDTLTLSAPTLPAWLSFDPATGILSGTPSNAEVGTHNVVLRVNDGTVDVDESFTITVSNANDAPTITSTAVTTATEDAAYSYTFAVNDVDVGDTLTLSAPTLPAWLSFDPATGILSGTPSNAEVGTHNVVLRVNDGTVDVDESFTITVSNANDAPTITSTAVTTATEDAAYSYTFAVNDVDVGDTLTLSAPTLPAWLSFDPATGILSGTPSNAEVGTHNVVLRVNDGTVDVDESFTITVSNANDAPTITSTAVTTATEDAAYSYTFAVNDVDVGDTLTLSAPTLPAWLSFDPATGILSGTPSNAEVGTHNVVLRVNDGTVDVDESFTITVSNANDAPVLGNNQMTLNSGDTVVINPAMLSATDVDHAPAGLQFTVSGVSGGQFELTSASGVAITSFTQAQVVAGDVVFVDDGDNVAPAYAVTVGDTVDSVGPRAATIVFNPPTVVTTVTPAPEPVPVIDPAPVPAPDPKPIVPDPSKPDPDPEPEPEPEPAPEPEPDEEPGDDVVVGGEDDGLSTSTAAGGSSVGPVAIVNFDSGSEGGSIGGLLKNLFVRPAALTAMALQQSLPGSFEIDALAKEVRDVLASTEFNSSLDRMRDGVSDATIFHQSVVGSSVAVTTGLSVGYVAWLVRGGVLLSTALSSLPAWQFIDPLPVLARTRDGKDGDDDSLQSIIKEQSERIASKVKDSGGNTEAGTPASGEQT